MTQVLTRGAPALFVLLWSTGFIGAKFGLPYAEPFTFLLIRLTIVAAVLAAVAAIMRAPWPKSGRLAAHIAVAGLLVHGSYLGGVFAAIRHGVLAGLTALIVGLQPLLTAAVAGPLLGERMRSRQWLGLALGLIGVALVVGGKLSLRADAAGIGFAVWALLGITVGTLYQKRFCTAMDLRSGTAIQYAAASALLAVLAVTTETMKVEWSGRFIFALAWLAIVLSVGAVFLLFYLIREGQAARVATLFYLVPPVTATLAWLLFGESLSALALVGFALTAVGVAIARR